MKTWPEDGSPVGDIQRLIDPLIVVYRANGRAKYEGYDIGATLKHVSLSPEERLSPEHLPNHDLLHGVLTVALQLGIEQGRRLATKGDNAEAVKILMQAIWDSAKRLAEASKPHHPEESIQLLTLIGHAETIGRR